MKRVSVSVDNDVVGEAGSVGGPLYVLPWTPSRYSTGLHTITVIATDTTNSETIVKEEFSLDDTRVNFSFFNRVFLMFNPVTAFQACFAILFIVMVLPLVGMKFIRLRLNLAFQSRMSNVFLRLLQSWLRRFALLASTPLIFYPLLIYDFYIVVGPWFIGYVLEEHIGACFLFGIVVNGAFLPGSLTYLYGVIQLIIFNIPLTLYLGRCLDISRKEPKPVSTWLRALVWLLDHGVFIVVVGIQCYLVLTGFYLSYGGLAVVLCPLRTWAIFLALYLRLVAVGTIGRRSPYEQERRRDAAAVQGLNVNAATVAVDNARTGDSN